MAGKAMPLSVATLLMASFTLASCFGQPGGWAPDPSPAYGFVPHIQNIDLPLNVKAGVPATFTLELSTALEPSVLLATSFQRLWAFHESDSLGGGQANGGYDEGRLYGLVAGPVANPVERSDLGFAAATKQVEITFDTPGTHHVYFGHAATEAAGGSSFSEFVLNRGFPAESEVIEYLQVTVEVEP
jgi:hypothetical protein